MPLTSLSWKKIYNKITGSDDRARRAIIFFGHHEYRDQGDMGKGLSEPRL